MRKPRDPDLADTVKALRKTCWEGLKERQAPFALESRQLIGDLDRSYPALQGLVQLVRDFARAYRQEKDRRQCWILGIWSTGPWSCCWAGDVGSHPAARETSRQFREIMVDEYQDTNEGAGLHFSGAFPGAGQLLPGGRCEAVHIPVPPGRPWNFLEKYREFAPASRRSQGREEDPSF